MNTRKVHTKIWRDGWFINLSRASKLLFMYLITNEYMGFTGYVEIPDQIIMLNTGLNSTELEASKDELYPKVMFQDDWIYVVNLTKHDPIQGGKANNVYKAYEKELTSIPEHIREILEDPSKTLLTPLGGSKERIGKEIEGESVREETKPVDEFIDFFNSKSGKNYQVTEERRMKLKKRLEKYSMAEIKRAVEALLKSPFHTGNDPKGNPNNVWYATPEFLLRSEEQVDKWLNSEAKVTSSALKGFR